MARMATHVSGSAVRPILGFGSSRPCRRIACTGQSAAARLLDASAPQRMMSGTSAAGDWDRSQWTHTSWRDAPRSAGVATGAVADQRGSLLLKCPQSGDVSLRSFCFL